MLPTLVGRSSRQALLAWRAMHHSFALYGMGESQVGCRAGSDGLGQWALQHAALTACTPVATVRLRPFNPGATVNARPFNGDRHHTGSCT